MNRSPDPVEAFLVGDEMSARESAAARLEREPGHPIRVVGSAEPTAAPDRLVAADPDCVVTSYHTDGPSGAELLRAVDDHVSPLPLVVFDDVGDGRDVRDAFRAGATDYVARTAGSAEGSETGGETVADEAYAALATRIRRAVAEHRPDVDREPDSDGDGAADADGGESPRSDSATGPTARDAEPGGVDTPDEGTAHADRGYRAGLDGRVLDASTTLMSAEVDEVGTKIEWTLETVGEFVGVDRCRLFQHDPEHAMFDPTHQWIAGGSDSSGPSFDAHPDGPIGWLVRRLNRFENVRVEETDALPDAAAGIRERCAEVGVRSFLAVPLVSEWELIGFLTVESEGSRRKWADHEVETVRTLGDLVAHTLARKERVETLERRNRQLDGFASTVSHDLRNPINVASGFLSIARETGDLSHLDRVESAVDRMELLVDDLLALAREGRTLGETAPVALAGTVRQAWSDVETGDVTLEVDPELGRLSADEPRLRRVLENLFRNALEHGESTSRIRVGPLADGSGFFVADDGRGIPPEKRASVFDRGHTGSEDGTGFGLAIVERIVEAHGWNVAAEASDSGGARFAIRTGDGGRDGGVGGADDEGGERRAADGTDDTGGTDTGTEDGREPSVPPARGG